MLITSHYRTVYTNNRALGLSCSSHIIAIISTLSMNTLSPTLNLFTYINKRTHHMSTVKVKCLQIISRLFASKYTKRTKLFSKKVIQVSCQRANTSGGYSRPIKNKQLKSSWKRQILIGFFLSISGLGSFAKLEISSSELNKSVPR